MHGKVVIRNISHRTDWLKYFSYRYYLRLLQHYKEVENEKANTKMLFVKVHSIVIKNIHSEVLLKEDGCLSIVIPVITSSMVKRIIGNKIIQIRRANFSPFILFRFCTYRMSANNLEKLYLTGFRDFFLSGKVNGRLRKCNVATNSNECNVIELFDWR